MVIFGSALFWVLVSSAVFVCCCFIFSIIRRIRIDRLLNEPPPPAQGQALYSASQVDVLRNLLADTGYAYDWNQNIFYSVMNPWQRKLGYCSLYDESSALMGMVIDCEPVRFEYGGKRWMIELWKGQYGITSGGEIGVYTTSWPDLEIPGVFNGTFYYCASNDDTLSMTYTLLKKDKVLFNRAARHWWLTGFKLGEYTKPSALSMEASITFKDYEMREAFLQALRKIGYKQDEYRYSGNTVLVLFSKPHSRQPLTRHGLVAWIALHEDRLNVWRYRKLTKGLANVVDILGVLQRESPLLYNLALNVGRPKQAYHLHEKIKPYIDEK